MHGFEESGVYGQLLEALSPASFQQSVFYPSGSPQGIEVRDKVHFPTVDFFPYVEPKTWLRGQFFTKTRKKTALLGDKQAIKEADLLHAHFTFLDGGLAYSLHQKLHKKYILTFQNTDLNIYLKKYWHTRSFGRAILQKAEAILFFTPRYRDELMENYIAKDLRAQLSKKCHILPYPIDVFWENNRNSTPKQKPNDKRRLQLLCVAELSENKNIHRLMDFVEARQDQKPMQLTVIGPEGDFTKTIRAKAETLPGLVQILPPTKDKEALLAAYRQADIFIMPSRFETFGQVFIEALSQGTPVLYPKGQAIDGLWENGQVGYPIEILDAEGCFKALNQVLEHYERISEQCIHQSRMLDHQTFRRHYEGIVRAAVL